MRKYLLMFQRNNLVLDIPQLTLEDYANNSISTALPGQKYWNAIK